MAVSCGVGRRRSSDLVLLWLWWRPAAAAPIPPLVWEPPYAAGVALKRRKNFFSFHLLTFLFLEPVTRSCVHFQGSRWCLLLMIWTRWALRVQLWVTVPSIGLLVSS